MGYIDSIEDADERDEALREQLQEDAETTEEPTEEPSGESIERIPVTSPTAPKRRALIQLHCDEIAQLLDLPEGMRVLHVTTDSYYDAIGLIVEGDMLEPIIPYAAYPMLPPGRWARLTSYHGGKVWTCWEWQPKEEDVPNGLS